MENGPFIGGLPMKTMVIFHGYVSLPEGVCIYIYIYYTYRLTHTPSEHVGPFKSTTCFGIKSRQPPTRNSQKRQKRNFFCILGASLPYYTFFFCPLYIYMYVHIYIYIHNLYIYIYICKYIYIYIILIY